MAEQFLGGGGAHHQRMEEEGSAGDEDERLALFASTLDTGDVVLFSRRCTSMSPLGAVVCLGAKLTSLSRFDHIGVVVRPVDGGPPRLLEANLRGVVSRPLLERLRRSRASEISVRRLQAHRTPAMREAAAEIERELGGRPYTSDLLTLFNAGMRTGAQREREALHARLLRVEAKGRELRADLSHRSSMSAFQRASLESEMEALAEEEAALRGAVHGGGGRSAFENRHDLSTVFCSALVAAAYQRMGLLPGYPVPHEYVPRDFADGSPPLALAGGAWLGAETRLRRKTDGGGWGLPESSSSSAAGATAAATPPGSSATFAAAMRLGPLSEAEALEAAARAETVVLRPGETMAAGDLHVVERGRLEAVVGGVAAGVLREGCVVGGGAAVRADGDAVLTRLPGAGDGRRRRKSRREAALLEEAVRSHPTFAHLAGDPARVREAARLFHRVDLGAGEVLFEQGAAADNFYVVGGGGVCEAVLSRPGGGGEGRVVTLAGGQAFGETGVLYDTPRGALVRARERSTVWALPRADFLRLSTGGSRHLYELFRRHARVKHRGQWFIPRERIDGLLRASFERHRQAGPPDEVAAFSAPGVEARVMSLLRQLTAPGGGGGDDHLVNFSEFVAFDMLLSRANSDLEVAFLLLDRERRGEVTRDELRREVVARRGLVSGEEFDADPAVRRAFDHRGGGGGGGGKGALSMAEFARLYRSGQLPPFVGAFAAQLDEDLERLYFHWWNSHAGALAAAAPDASQHLREVLASGAAGAAARFALHPLAQARITAMLGARGEVPPPPPVPLLRAAARSFSGGLAAAYRGALVASVRSLAVMTGGVAIYSQLRARVAGRGAARVGGRLSAADNFAAGAAAGALAGAVVYPLDLFRARAAAALAAGDSTRRPVVAYLRAAWRAGGSRAVFRGQAASSLYASAFVGTKVAVYEELREPVSEGAGGGAPWYGRALSAASAAVAASASALVVSHPLDVARRQYQAHDSLRSATQAAAQIVRARGVGGLYTGLGLGLVRVLPTACITLALFGGSSQHHSW